MPVTIAGVSDGDHPFAFTVQASDLDLEGFTGNVQVDGVLHAFASQFTVQANCSGILSARCDRCLDDMQQELRPSVKVFYGAPGMFQDDNDDHPDLRSLVPDQTTIVLDDDVRSALILDVPLKLLCSEDCKGLCAQCGANLNSEQCSCQSAPPDPRWAALASLLKGNDNDN